MSYFVAKRITVTDHKRHILLQRERLQRITNVIFCYKENCGNGSQTSYFVTKRITVTDHERHILLQRELL